MTPPFPALHHLSTLSDPEHHLSTLSTMRIRPASPVSCSAVRTRQCPAPVLCRTRNEGAARVRLATRRWSAGWRHSSTCCPRPAPSIAATTMRGSSKLVPCSWPPRLAGPLRVEAPCAMRVQHHLPFERMPNGVLVMNQVPSPAACRASNGLVGPCDVAQVLVSPPYGKMQCLSDNEICLTRVKKLLPV